VSIFVSTQDTVCTRHEPAATMELRSMHSDSTRPDVLVGLFVCPACGHETRRPLELVPA
jgi:hypothetical protein